MISRTELHKSVLLSFFRILVKGWHGRGQCTKASQIFLSPRHALIWWAVISTWTHISLGHLHNIQAESFHLLNEINDPVKPITQLHQICMIHSYNQSPKLIQVTYLQDEMCRSRKFWRNMAMTLTPSILHAKMSLYLPVQPVWASHFTH